MGNKNDNEIEEFEEFNERKEGSGQFESSRNPKGAGRPSTEWRDYQEFKEWQNAREAGFIPRDLSELLRGVVDSSQGRGEGDSKPDVKGLLAQLGEVIGIKKKDLDKLGLADEQVTKGLNYVFKTLIPSSPQLIFVLAGVGWYVVGENLKVTKTFSQAEWDELGKINQASYFDVTRTTTEVVPEDISLNPLAKPVMMTVIKATKYRYSRPIHLTLDIVFSLLEIIQKIYNVLTGESTTSLDYITKNRTYLPPHIR